MAYSKILLSKRYGMQKVGTEECLLVSSKCKNQFDIKTFRNFSPILS